MNLREKIMKANDRPVEAVSCPEWDCVLFVRAPSAGQRDDWENGNVKVARNPKDSKITASRARLVVSVTEDEDGKLLFTPEDATWLATKSAVVVDRLFEVARRLGGMREEEGAEKNSVTIRESTENTCSPGN